MGLDCIWNLDLDLDLSRFHLLLLQDCAFLLLVSFYLGHIHARARARTHPLPGPFPPHPTPSHERFIHLGITSISLQPPPPPHAPLLTPTTTLPAFLHFATPITSAKPVPKDSSRAAVTYFTFSFSFSFLSYIYNFARESCIYCTYMLARIFFVVYLVLIRGFRIVHSGPLTWCL